MYQTPDRILSKRTLEVCDSIWTAIFLFSMGAEEVINVIGVLIRKWISETSTLYHEEQKTNSDQYASDPQKVESKRCQTRIFFELGK